MLQTKRLLLALLLIAASPVLHSAEKAKPNVLFIIADDLTATALSCYENKVCKTPNIDRLAAQGTRYTRAFCQFPVCGPSRASFMSGYYPHATGTMGYTSGRQNIGDRATWSQHFINNGYHAARVSKIFHMGVPGDIEKGSNGTDDEASWSERFNSPGPEWKAPGDGELLENNPDGTKRVKGGNTLEYVKADGDDLVHSDGKTARKACELLRQYQGGKPFFLAVGFVRPHVPLVAPRTFYEPYDSAGIVLPEKVPGDWDDIPKAGINYKTSRNLNLNTEQEKKGVAAYYASVAFMDAQVGKVLDTLRDAGLEDNAIPKSTNQEMNRGGSRKKFPISRLACPRRLAHKRGEHLSNMKQSIDLSLNRRKFIQRTAAGVALFNILPGRLLSGAESSPNAKLNVAGIGIGSRGGAIVGEVAGLGHNFTALCDVDSKYAAKEFAKYPNAKQFKDYRVMLDQMGKEIDAVMIGTPDHTHAVIAMEAMRRGKHVYCEKPLAHTVQEVRELVAASKKHKVVTQLGNQGHSSTSIRRVCEWVWAGAIGKVHTIHAGCNAFKNVYCQIPNLGKLGQEHPVPDTLDYDLWVGPVEFRPYSPLWVPWNWRGWMHFGGGTIGDWICHVLDPAYWALDLDAPTSVVAEAKDYDPARHGATYPSATMITFEFPAKKERGPVKLVWHDGDTQIPKPADFPADEKVPSTGAILFGDQGMIVHGSHGGGGCHLLPDKLMDQFSGKNAPAEKIPRVKGHGWDWIEAIRTGRPAGSDFSYGGPLTQVALLGLIALRFPGQKLEWNDQAVKFTNHKAASAFLESTYRRGWKL